MLAVEEIEANVAGIRGTLQQLLAASDQHASDLRPAVFLNNLVGVWPSSPRTDSGSPPFLGHVSGG